MFPNRGKSMAKKDDFFFFFFFFFPLDVGPFVVGRFFLPSIPQV